MSKLYPLLYRLLSKQVAVAVFVVYASASYAVDLRGDSIDITHISLYQDYSDFGSRNLVAKATLSIKSKKNSIDKLRLDLLKLAVDSVWYNTTSISFQYNDTLLKLNFPSPLLQNQTADISIFYHGTPYQNPADFGGFYWTTQYAFNIGVSFLSDPHNFGRVWFPCFDNFLERSTYSFHITTDATRKAFCNGNLDSTTVLSNTNLVWHWTMNDPIPSYLACVSVSDYQSLNDTVQSLNGTLPVLLAARATDTTKLKNSFVNLKKALHIFEDLFGPYQFNKIGYSVVPFNAGAMEHATNIAYMQAVVNGFTQYENLMAHELSHHWFGDLATCESAEEMWLNEGWASYCEALFYEKMYSKSKANDALRKSQEDVLRLAHIKDSTYWPVSGVPTAYTYSTQSVYEHGSLVAHSLRSYMGDSVFFSCMKNYLQTYKFQDVNSLKLRDFLTNCSGKNLTTFFENWVFSPGYTHFSILDKKVIARGLDNYEITLNIRQRLNNAPALYQQVPVEISYFAEDGSREIHSVILSGECSQFTHFVSFNPSFIALDYDEKIPDAITNEVRKITSPLNYDFGTAKASISVNTTFDSSLVRIEHHWLAPDVVASFLEGYQLSDTRYWTVDGIFSPSLNADLKLLYNGSTNINSGYLDNSFINKSEDSLVVLYRENQSSAWQLADSFKVYPQSSKTDKIGYAIVYGVKKGDYAFAMQSPNLITSAWSSNCNLLSISPVKSSIPTFDVYPNPTNTEEVKVALSEVDFFTHCIVHDYIGNKVVERSIAKDQNSFTILLNGLSRGTYVITLKTKRGSIFSKKIIKTQ